MSKVTLVNSPLTPEELNYVNVLNPCICPVHNKPATLSYNTGELQLNVCCDALISIVRLQISEQKSKLYYEQ